MVYITGDIHGSAEPLYDLFERFQPTEDDIIVLLGDVGVNYTGRMRDRLLKQELCDMKSTFFCIHGNHEMRPWNVAGYHLTDWQGGPPARMSIPSRGKGTVVVPFVISF